MRAVCAARNARWDAVLRLASRQDDPRVARALADLVQSAVDALRAELLSLDVGDRPLLLHEAGLLAHYGRLDALDAVRGGKLPSMSWPRK